MCKLFRFDFSHFENLSREQITAVDTVNQLIRRNFPESDVTMEDEMGACSFEKIRRNVVNFGPNSAAAATPVTGNIGCLR